MIRAWGKGAMRPAALLLLLLVEVAVFMIALFWWASRRISTQPRKTGVVALLEVAMVWVRDEVVYPWLGPERGRKYLGFFWTLLWFTANSLQKPLQADFGLVHPLTGPVFVAGAEPGDLLVAEILEVIPQPFGFTAQVPGFGFLRHDFPDPFLVRLGLGPVASCLSLHRHNVVFILAVSFSTLARRVCQPPADRRRVVSRDCLW